MDCQKNTVLLEKAAVATQIEQLKAAIAEAKEILRDLEQKELAKEKENNYQ